MIEEFSFGKIVIDGVDYTSDIKVIRKKVVPNWWRKKGHRVASDDIQDIMKEKPDILVLGKGQPGQMTATKELRNILSNNSIELVEESTPEAVKTFNRLVQEGKNVAAGFHLTC